MATRNELFDALDELVNAWEELPSGNYQARVVARWLVDDMKPAIDRAREVLERQPPEN